MDGMYKFYKGNKSLIINVYMMSQSVSQQL